MTRTRFLLAAALLLLLSAAAAGQVGLDKVGQSTMNFQMVNVSARGAAMGDAVYAVSTGAEAIFFNPAGMAEMTRTVEIGFMTTQWIADINYVAGAAAWNLGNYGSVGVGALSVDYGTIHATRLLPAASQGNVTYEDAGDMHNVSAYSFGLTYAKGISKEFSIGGTMRYTGQNLGQSILAGGLKENNAAKLVFDVGVKYYTGFRSFRFGMAFRNFSSQLQREKLNEQMPVTFTLATAMDLLDLVSPGREQGNMLTLGVDYLHSNNFSERMNFGLEYVLKNTLALRGGYQTNRDIASWSAGIGLMTTMSDWDIRVDYSYSQFTYFNGVNRISVEVGL